MEDPPCELGVVRRISKSINSLKREAFETVGDDTVDGSEIPNNHVTCMKPCK